MTRSGPQSASTTLGGILAKFVSAVRLINGNSSPDVVATEKILTLNTLNNRRKEPKKDPTMKSNRLSTILRMVMIIAVLSVIVAPLSAQQMIAKNSDGDGRVDNSTVSPSIAKSRVIVNDGGTGDTGKTKDLPASALPRVIKFSGALPVSGDVVAGATAQVTFSLYADENGGSPLWTETHTVTLDAQGKYSVLLGTSTGDGMPTDLFSDSSAHWLAAKADGQAEAARSLLVSVPYALKAVEADRLGGRAASDYISQSQLDEAVKSAVVRQATSGNLARMKDANGPISTGTSLTGTSTTQILFVQQLGTGDAIDAFSSGAYALYGSNSSATGIGGYFETSVAGPTAVALVANSVNGLGKVASFRSAGIEKASIDANGVLTVASCVGCGGGGTITSVVNTGNDGTITVTNAGGPIVNLKVGVIGTANLGAGVVTGANIAAATITGANIANGGVGSAQLANSLTLNNPTITTTGIGAVPLTVTGVLGQAVDLVDVKNSLGTIITKVDQNGNLTATSFNGSGAGLTNINAAGLTLAGDVTGLASADVVSKIQGNTVTGTTGTGNVVFATSPTISGANFTGNMTYGTLTGGAIVAGNQVTSTGTTLNVTNVDNANSTVKINNFGSAPGLVLATGNGLVQNSFTVDNSGNVVATKFTGNGSGLTNLVGANISAIPNSSLVNSSITVNTGAGLSGGAVVALGGTVNLANTGTLSVTGAGAGINVTAGQNPVITNTGVTSVLQTPNQITVSSNTGAVLLSLPNNLIVGSATTTTGTILKAANNDTNVANATATFNNGGATGLVIATGNGSINPPSFTVDNAGNVTATKFTGPLTGAVTGNASTATKLATGNTINGVNFDGSAPITVTAAAGTLTGGALAAGITASSLTTVGTLTSLNMGGAITMNGNVISGGGAITGTTISGTSLSAGTGNVAGGSGTFNQTANNVDVLVGKRFNDVTPGTNKLIKFTDNAGITSLFTVDATGAVVATSFAGNGAGLTNLSPANMTLAGEVTGPGNATVVSKIAGVTVGGATGTGNVVFATSPTVSGMTATGSNSVGGVTLNAGAITAAGAISGATTVSASGNISGGSLTSSGGVAAGGAITGATTVTASGTITGGALSAAGSSTIGGVTLNGGAITAAGSISGATTITASGLVTAGSVTAGTGNIAGGSGTFNQTANNVDVLTGKRFNDVTPGTNKLIKFTDNAGITSLFTVDATGAVVATSFAGNGAGLTNLTASQFTLAGDITGAGNATTVSKIQGTTVAGTSGTGNVVFATSPTMSGITSTGSNNVGGVTLNGGAITAAGAISGATTVSASGNISGGSLTSAGGVAAGGAITGATTITASGIIIGATLNATTGGALINGGINNTAGGITNTGAISGATTITANNTITSSAGNNGSAIAAINSVNANASPTVTANNTGNPGSLVLATGAGAAANFTVDNTGNVTSVGGTFTGNGSGLTNLTAANITLVGDANGAGNNTKVTNVQTSAGASLVTAINNAAGNGTISVVNGGTGAATAAGARANLGAAVLGANTDITSLTGLTGAVSGATTINASGTITGGALSAAGSSTIGGVTLNGGAVSGVTTLAASNTATIAAGTNGKAIVASNNVNGAASPTATFNNVGNPGSLVVSSGAGGAANFTVDNNGAVVATSFTGNGAGLTNLTPANMNLAGDVTGTGAATVVSKIQGTTVAGTTGSGNVVFATSPTVSGITATGSNSVGGVTLNGGAITAAGAISGATTITGSGAATVGSVVAGNTTTATGIIVNAANKDAANATATFNNAAAANSLVISSGQGGAANFTVTNVGAVTGSSFTGPLTGNVTGNLTGNVTGNLTGNASTATKLLTGNTINGVNFDGSAPITVTAAAGTLTGATLNGTVVNSSLTSVGTLTGLTMGGALNLATNNITNGGSITSTSLASGTETLASTVPSLVTLKVTGAPTQSADLFDIFASGNPTALVSVSPAGVITGNGSGITGVAASTLANTAAAGNSAVTAINAGTGIINLVNGGTGASTATAARANLVAAQSGANTDLTSITGLTGAISGGTTVTASGNISGGSFTSSGTINVGNGSSSVGGVTLNGGNVSATNGVNLNSSAIQGVTSLSATGNITTSLGNITATAGTFNGNGSGLTNLTGANMVLSGEVTGTGAATVVSKIGGTTVVGATGTGANVFATSPTLVTPALGAASYTSLNGGSVTATSLSSSGGVAAGGAITGATTVAASGNISGASLTATTGGASVTGGLNNNTGGITNAGAISGATTIGASGLITASGGINNTGGISGTGGISSTGTVDFSGSAFGSKSVHTITQAVANAFAAPAPIASGNACATPGEEILITNATTPAQGFLACVSGFWTAFGSAAVDLTTATGILALNHGGTGANASTAGGQIQAATNLNVASLLSGASNVFQSGNAFTGATTFSNAVTISGGGATLATNSGAKVDFSNSSVTLPIRADNISLGDPSGKPCVPGELVIDTTAAADFAHALYVCNTPTLQFKLLANSPTFDLILTGTNIGQTLTVGTGSSITIGDTISGTLNSSNKGTINFSTSKQTSTIRQAAFAGVPPVGACTPGELLQDSTPVTPGQVVFVCNQAGTQFDLLGSTTTFAQIGTGTNTTATMTLGAGSTFNINGGLFQSGGSTIINNTGTFTNSKYDTASAGNVFKINGTTISAVTGTGAVVLATSPTITTSTLAGATMSGALAMGGNNITGGGTITGTTITGTSFTDGTATLTGGALSAVTNIGLTGTISGGTTISSSGAHTGKNFVANTGAIAASLPSLSATATWNSGVAATGAFTGLFENVTSSANYSPTTSFLIDLQRDGVSKFSVDANGKVSFSGGVSFDQISTGTNISAIMTLGTGSALDVNNGLITRNGGTQVMDKTGALTNVTFNTAATGNVFQINGTGITAVTGTGAVVLATSPTITTSTLAGATMSGALAMGGNNITGGGTITGTTITGTSIKDSTATLTGGSLSGVVNIGLTGTISGGTTISASGSNTAKNFIANTGAIAASLPSLSATATWNSGVAATGNFTGLFENVTSSANYSPTTSFLIDLQRDGVSKFSVDANGKVSFSGGVSFDQISTGTNISAIMTLGTGSAIDINNGLLTRNAGTQVLDKTGALTNVTFNTAATGNTFQIAGTGITAVTGTGAVVLATSPTITTSTLAGATMSGTLNMATNNITNGGTITGTTITGTTVAATTATAGANAISGSNTDGTNAVNSNGVFGTTTSSNGAGGRFTNTNGGTALSAGSGTNPSTDQFQVTSAGNVTAPQVNGGGVVLTSAIAGSNLTAHEINSLDYLIFNAHATNAGSVGSLSFIGAAGNPLAPFNGDLWYDITAPAAGLLKYFDGTTNQTLLTSGSGVTLAGDVTGNSSATTVVKIQNVSVGTPTGTAGSAVVLATSPTFNAGAITLNAATTFTGSLIPTADNTYSLGNAARWSNLQVGTGTSNFDGTVNIGPNSTSGVLNVNNTTSGLGIATLFGSLGVDFSFDGGADGTFFLQNVGVNTGHTSIVYNGAENLTVLNSNGNVGIGNTNPGSKLDVSGNVNVSTAGNAITAKNTNAAVAGGLNVLTLASSSGSGGTPLANAGSAIVFKGFNLFNVDGRFRNYVIGGFVPGGNNKGFAWDTCNNGDPTIGQNCSLLSNAMKLDPDGNLTIAGSFTPTGGIGFDSITNSLAQNNGQLFKLGTSNLRLVGAGSIQDSVGNPMIYSDGSINATSKFLANAVGTAVGAAVIVTTPDSNTGNTPLFNSQHFVVGNNLAAGAGSGGVGISYSAADNAGNGVGYIGALQPGVAWSNLVLQAGSGNVGIGIATPQAKLDVNGSIEVNNFTVNDANLNGTNLGTTTNTIGGYNSISANAQGNSVFLSSGGINIDQGSNNDGNNTCLLNGPGARCGFLVFGSGSGEAIGSDRNGGVNNVGLDFYTSYTNRMAITNGGSVGIGTATPAALLDVAGNGIFQTNLNLNTSHSMANNSSSAAVLDITGGADSADAGGLSDPHAIAFQYHSNGFRHWISTEHHPTIANLNTMKFYINDNSAGNTPTDSFAPGVGNKLAMTIDGLGNLTVAGSITAGTISGNLGFDKLTTATNTTAAMTVGNGSSLLIGDNAAGGFLRIQCFGSIQTNAGSALLDCNGNFNNAATTNNSMGGVGLSNGIVTATQFNGSGAGLTNNTVPDAALSANVALLNRNSQTFTGTGPAFTNQLTTTGGITNNNAGIAATGAITGATTISASGSNTAKNFISTTGVITTSLPSLAATATWTGANNTIVFKGITQDVTPTPTFFDPVNSRLIDLLNTGVSVFSADVTGKIRGDGSLLTNVAAGTANFANIATGTNTTATMTLGSGSSLVAAAASTAVVDFSGAGHTLPAQTGTVFPATCTVGELWVKTNPSSAGQQVYVCSNAVGPVWSLVGDGSGNQTINNYAAPTTITLTGVATLQPAMTVALNANQLQVAGNTIEVTIHGYNTVNSSTTGNAPIVYELHLCQNIGCVGGQNNVLQVYTQQSSFTSVPTTFNLPWEIKSTITSISTATNTQLMVTGHVTALQSGNSNAPSTVIQDPTHISPISATQTAGTMYLVLMVKPNQAVLGQPFITNQMIVHQLF